MDQRLVQQQSQRMVLSPQIRQYLRVLQLPLAQLAQAVETELAENPILEEVAPSKPDDNLQPSLPENQPQETVASPEVAVGESYDEIARMDENFWESYNYLDTAKTDLRELQKRKNYEESLITKPEVLADFLLWQTRFLDLNDEDRRLAEEIIGNIDEEGYLRASLEEIAASCRQDVSRVEHVLCQLQRELDPPGIGARNLQEALLIQLRKKGPEASLALKIISDHLPLVEKRLWHELAKLLNVDLEQIRQAAHTIEQLEPRPGRTFYLEEPIAVTPDASVSLLEGGNEKYKIEVHEESIPHLRINPYYRRLLRDQNADEKTKLYIREKLQAGLNFLRALKLRKSTLRQITEEIVEVQSQFFEKGFSHLVPLRLKDIANRLGIHESTVSRALQGKYLSTPQGTIPYKSFFSARIETAHGEAESQKSIIENIKNVLDKEDPAHPLSDQDLVNILQEQGVKIARRTVAKYRDILKILPSHLRRRR